MERRPAIAALQQLALMLELLDEDTADASAISACAWALRQAETPPDEWWPTGFISSLPGIDARLAAVIDDAAHQRVSPWLTSLQALLPAGLLEVGAIKGLGPKKVRALWKELDVTNLSELEYACNENRLVDLKGFGEKTQASVLEQVAALRAQVGRMRVDVATSIASEAVSALAPHLAAVAGDLARGCDLVSEVVVVTTAPEGVAAEIQRTLQARGQVRVVSVAADAMARVLVEETSDDAHLSALKTQASTVGSAWSQIGATHTVDFYAALGLLETPAERRCAGVPLVHVGKPAPRLVQRSSLRGLLHNHTTASDGTASMAQMHAAAQARGYSYLAITEHSVSAGYASGLDANQLVSQHNDVVAFNAHSNSACVLLSGVESDILRDGALDYPTETLHGVDIVVASIHARFAQRGVLLTERVLKAVRHPAVDILGHPTGRLLLGRAPMDFDMDAVLQACAACGVAVELNANPARLDLDATALATAKAYGVLVSIAADAHSVEALDHAAYGVACARRAGLCDEDVLNTRTVAELRAWKAARRTRVVA